MELVTGIEPATSSLQERRSTELSYTSELFVILPHMEQILVCPACRGNVERKPDGSGLRCLSCHRLYPIRDGVAIMLIAEASIDDTEWSG